MLHDDVIVLAAGPSVLEYNIRDLERRGHLIAINGAGLYTKPHVALTMDRLIAEYCHPVWQVQGVPEIWVRASVVKNFKPGDRTTLFNHDGTADTMTMARGYLNGSNSGTCGFNLAMQRANRRIFMLGFDMQRGDGGASKPYWYPPFSWSPNGSSKDGRMAVWAAEFRDIARSCEYAGLEVYNVNHRSVIEAFPCISYKRFLEMTRVV